MNVLLLLAEALVVLVAYVSICLVLASIGAFEHD